MTTADDAERLLCGASSGRLMKR